MTDERWLDFAIRGANRVGIFGTMFASTPAHREHLRDALSFVFTVLTEE